MFNKELVKDLEEDILLQAIAIFIKNTEKELLLLADSNTKSETQEVIKLSHKLAGSSISVGLENFHTLAKTIENKKGVDVAGDIEKLITEFKNIKTFFNK